jgi:hypothetical protein
MTRRIPLSLDVIDIQTPCTASWDAMRGDDRVRFCDQCRLNVYDLSAMTREAATKLVSEREGRLCVRFFRRADGTVLTADGCGRVRAAARRAKRVAVAMAGALFAAVLTPFGFASRDNSQPRAEMGDVCVAPAPTTEPAVMGKVAAAPTTRPAVMGEVATVPTMGIVAMPTTHPSTTRPATRPTTRAEPLMGGIGLPPKRVESAR